MEGESSPKQLHQEEIEPTIVDSSEPTLGDTAGPAIIDEPIITSSEDVIDVQAASFDNGPPISYAPEVVVSLVEEAPRKVSPFKESKDRAKYLCKSSKFVEAREVIEKEIEQLKESEYGIEETSRLYLRYILVIFKAYNFKLLGKAYVKYIEPALKTASEEGNVIA
jgi:hypothetical protein